MQPTTSKGGGKGRGRSRGGGSRTQPLARIVICLMCNFTGTIPVAPTVADKDLSVCGYDLCRYDTYSTRAMINFETSIGGRTLAQPIGIRPNAPPASRVYETVSGDRKRVDC